MKDRTRILFKDRFIFYASSLMFVFVLVLIVLVMFSYTSLPPLIPVFNSMPWGLSRLYVSSIVLYLPLSIGLVVILNLIILVLIYKKFTLLSRILSFNSLLLSLLAVLAYLQILLLIN